MKHESERLINTRSLSSRNVAVVHINNIDMYTWLYMMKDAPVAIESRTVVCRAGHVPLTEFIQQSWRELQFSLWVGNSDHLAFVQELFGLNFGIGV